WAPWSWHSARFRLPAAWWARWLPAPTLRRWLTLRVHLLLLLHLQRDLMVEYVGRNKHVRVAILHTLLVYWYMLLSVVHGMHHDVVTHLHKAVLPLRINRNQRAGVL